MTNTTKQTTPVDKLMNKIWNEVSESEGLAVFNLINSTICLKKSNSDDRSWLKDNITQLLRDLRPGKTKRIGIQYTNQGSGNLKDFDIVLSQGRISIAQSTAFQVV